jgi:hypothetical protein
MSNTHQIITSSHSDWRVFYGKAERAVFFSNYAYSQKDKEMQELANKIPQGYELFLMTDHVNEVGGASFRCVAFMNQNTKDIVFATAGSRFGLDKKGIADAYDDLRLAFHSKPRKMNPAQILNNIILDSLGEQAKDYKFHYTGHSLGAAMAELQAADMDIKLTKKNLKSDQDFNQISAVTFENPGTKPIIEGMYKNADLPKENISKLNFCEFNNRKNIINSLNEQTGRTYTIIPYSQKERNPSLIQMVFGFVAKTVSSHISSIIGKAFGLLGVGGIFDNLQAEHSLNNFNEIFVKKEGKIKTTGGHITSMEEAYSNIKPLKFDQEIAEELFKLKEKNGNIGKQQFSMTQFDAATGKLIRIVFSNEELSKVANELVVQKKSNHTSMVDRMMQDRSKKLEINKGKTTMELPTAQDQLKSGLSR